MGEWAKLLRFKHWVKNVLVLFPLIFSGRLIADPRATVAGLLATAAFCLVSSAVYILNDMHDVEKDRLHPVKRNRPIASGAISVAQARTALIVLVVCAAVLDMAAAGLSNWAAHACIAGYLAINVAYSRGLKNAPVLDVVILAAGFFLRVLYGSVACAIHLSMWMYLTVLTLSFYLGLGKRRGEFSSTGSTTRSSLSGYSERFLETNMTAFYAMGMVFYSLWASDIANTYNGMFLTVPLVFCICLRYSYLIDKPGLGDPVEVVYHDKVLIALILAFAVVMLGILYL